MIIPERAHESNTAPEASARSGLQKIVLAGRPHISWGTTVLVHRNSKIAVMASWDMLCWCVATILVAGARYDFEMSQVQWASTARYLITSVGLLLLGGYILKMYRGRFHVASFEEMVGLATLVLGVATVTVLIFIGLSSDLPRGIAFLAPPVALVGSAAGRWAYRSMRSRSPKPAAGIQKRVLVYGAGEAGHQLVRLLLGSKDSGFRVVGLIDDDLGKRNLQLIGVPMIGTRGALAHARTFHRAECVILAIPSASGELIGEIQSAVESAGMELLALRPVSEMIGGAVRLDDVREVEIGDILGRHQVKTDLTAITGYLHGRKILITGAGGSIGSELARQVSKFSPAELILLDRDESALHAVQLSIYGHGLLDTPDVVLCDVRDAAALRTVFQNHRPEIIFHAAALKHLPMLQRYPEEGWKTNVYGTLSMLRLAQEFGAERFVNISTDKAADPTSVLGETKRKAEQFTAWFARDSERRYMSVRFGNVLGSRGSVMHAFTAQIEAGGPVTVTDPEISRYFMTITEACELVMQAGAIGGPGEVLVLDMGMPVKIVDVAERMIAQSGKKIEIVFTGLRDGEKLHEDLFGAGEEKVTTSHPLISSVQVPPLSPDDLPDRDVGIDWSL